MLIIYSILFGIVQGLTEFLPISSSGHLIILHNFLSLPLGDSLAFDVALHLGTFIALVLFFFKDVVNLIKAFLASLINWNLGKDFEQRLAWMILVSSLPVFLVGYLIADQENNYFSSLKSVAIMLIVFGFFFFLYERFGRKNLDLEQMGWRSALRIGLVQVLSLIPGVSRSGITIIAGLGEGLKRDKAARFSFLLSIPAVFGAAVKKGFDLSQSGLNASELMIFATGAIASAIVGFFCIKYFLKFVQKYSLDVFAWYRIVLGAVILLWLKIYG